MSPWAKAKVPDQHAASVDVTNLAEARQALASGQTAALIGAAVSIVFLLTERSAIPLFSAILCLLFFGGLKRRHRAASAVAAGGLAIVLSWLYVTISDGRFSIWLTLGLIGLALQILSCVKAVFLYASADMRRGPAELASAMKPGPFAKRAYFLVGSLRFLAVAFTASASLILWSLWNNHALYSTLDFDARSVVEWLSGPQLFTFLVPVALALLLLGLSAYLERKAKQVAAISAVNLRQRDERPPVLLLRPFKDDMMRVESSDEGILEKMRSLVGIKRSIFEEAITDSLWRYGPVVALGEPDEFLPSVGAAREYIHDESWWQRAEALIHESKLIVIVVGTSKHLLKEACAVHTIRQLQSVLLVIPPVESKSMRLRWTGFLQALEKEASPESSGTIAALKSVPATTLVVAIPEGHSPRPLIGGSRKVHYYEEAILEGVHLITGPGPQRVSSCSS